MTAKKAVETVRCDQWRSGVCSALAEAGSLIYCPRARAVNCDPGACTHHPLSETHDRLAEIQAAGVDVARYGDKLGEPAFVERLYSAFLKARSRRSTT